MIRPGKYTRFWPLLLSATAFTTAWRRLTRSHFSGPEAEAGA